MATFYLVDHADTSADYSNITDLAVMLVAGELQLVASTRNDGTLTNWAVDGAGLTLMDTVEYRGGLVTGGTGSITTLDLDTGPMVLTGGGHASGALQTHTITSSGQLAQHDRLLDADALGLAGLTHGASLALGNGTYVVYGGIAGADGIGAMAFDAAGNFQSTSVIADTNAVFAADISDVATAQIGQDHYVLTASGTENGVTVWAASAGGALTATDSIGTEDGLWIAAPTAMQTATVAGQTFVVLAAAGSGSLSVMALDAAGQLSVTDHVIDSLNSRFGGASDLAVVEHHGQIYVIAGGADDGISVFLLREDGTLLARGHIADTTQTSLENVSAIAAVSAGDGIDIFVSSSATTGITQLHFDTGPAGQVLNADAAGGALGGTAGMDIINGAAGDDRLSGGAGDDVLTDGAGADLLTGGAGADTFVLAYDGSYDRIADFELGVDQIDLSAWSGLRSTAQLTFTARADGVRISYGAEVLIVQSADGQPIDPARFGATDLIGDAHVPQNITAGFAGPATDVPDLPDRPAYTPYVYEAPAADPTPEPGIDIVPDVRTDTNTPDPETPTDSRVTMGSNGNDILTATAAQPIIYGMDGADRLNGSSGANTLDGGAGADTIYGRGGADRIIGDAGADKLYGNGGNDTITGNAGDDLVKGGGGTDDLAGGGGHDKIKGGGGDDTLNGNDGNDRLFGGGGNDIAFGDEGRDKIKGGRGADQISGGADDDTLLGGGGGDRLWGGSGRDFLNGNNGDDIMTGGSGADTFVFTRGDDQITDFAPWADTLQLDDKNWRGDLTPQEVVDRYASVQGRDIVFDFGGGDTLTLTGVTNLGVMDNVIEII